MVDSIKSKITKKVVISTVVLILAIVASIIYYFYFNQNNIKSVVEVDTIYQGITINGVDVSNLTKEEAENRIEEVLQSKISDMGIDIKYEESSWVLKYDVIEINFNINKAVEEAYNLGRTGEVRDRYEEIMEFKKSGLNIEAEYVFNEEKIDKFIEAISMQVNIPVEDSQITRENGQFIITQEQPGLEIDVEKTKELILEKLENGKDGTIELPVTATEPEITKEDNEKATVLIGSFYTSYSGGPGLGRNINLKVGTDNINGTILKPGEIFSTNESLGDQSYAGGYRNAAVIVNGKLEDGLGGGVCQISTTLYNAAILAELEIVERRNHSLPVGYIELGRDAAVAGNVLDFKFKNSTDYPIYIETYLENNELHANIYGYEEHEPGREVVFERVHAGTIGKPPEKVILDPNLDEGERVIEHKGRTGTNITTYKKVFQDGELISREWFTDSSYRAVADEVRVGTKPIDGSRADSDSETITTITEPSIDTTESGSDATEPSVSPTVNEDQTTSSQEVNNPEENIDEQNEQNEQNE